jgi:16S rRNA (cytidine1402-2'-O)-methyltransferase
MPMNKDQPFQGGKRAIVYLVGVPIGNLKDISSRALEILSEADIIACEDTRMTGSLLSKLGIRPKKLVSCFAQKEKEEASRLLSQIKDTSEMLAYVSDAGMPGISDPGALLAEEAINEGISVSSIPGPTAFVPALIASGFDTADFSFYGFLPVKSSARAKLLNELKDRKETLIFYEAPHRLLETLEALKEVLGSERRISLARELTKAFEEYTRGTIAEVLSSDLTLKGEFVIVVEGAKEEKKEMDSSEIIQTAQKMLKEGMRKSEIAKIISDELNVNKNSIYTLIKDI